MLRAMKYLLAVAALLSLTFPARAQKVDFEVGAPGVVAVGEACLLYTSDAADELWV